jgi:hypothetical protein
MVVRQLLSSSIDPRLHRPFRQLEPFSDFLITQVVDVVWPVDKYECFTLI